MGGRIAVILVTGSTAQEWLALAPEGVNVRYFTSCGSTNALAVEEGAAGLSKPTWFVAGNQTSGRGRRGKTWASEPGNLYCSYLFRPPVKIAELVTLPYLVSLAIRDVFLALGCKEDEVRCKWPNDVLINEKKSSGILIESSAASGRDTDFVVVGIGLNLVCFPNSAQFPATSVKDEIGGQPDIGSAFKILSHGLQRRLKEWNPADVSHMISEWRDCAWGMGLRREIRTAEKSFSATLLGISDQGGLRLRLDDGSETNLYAGDVFGPPPAH